MSDDLTDVIIKDELCSQCDSPSLVWRHCMNVTCPNKNCHVIDDVETQELIVSSCERLRKGDTLYTAADLQREKFALLDEVVGICDELEEDGKIGVYGLMLALSDIRGRT